MLGASVPRCAVISGLSRLQRLSKPQDARRALERDAAVFQGRLSKFKDQLAALPFFKTQLPDANSIKFKGFSQPTVDKDDLSRSYVSFTLECSFPEKTR